jgi:hypothetical protein
MPGGETGEGALANWQASLLMQTLSTGTVLVLQRDPVDEQEVPTLHGGDTFYGSLPDGDPFGGTVMQRQQNRAVVEVAGKRYHLHQAQPHETTDHDLNVEQPHECWVID